MTSIKVQGTLRSPLGTPLYPATIRLTAIDTVGDTPTLAEAVYNTEPTGDYVFDLSYGYFELEVNSTDEYSYIAKVIVDEATPTVITLADLVQYSTPVVPHEVIPEDADWEALHDNVRNGINSTTRVKIDQLSDTDAYENETKRLIINDTVNARMSEETVTTNVGNTKLVNQSNVYEDTVMNQSLQQTSIGSTLNVNYSKGFEAYEASNGKGQIVETLTYDVGDAASNFRNELTNTQLTLQDSHNVGLSTVTKDAVITATSVANNSDSHFELGTSVSDSKDNTLYEYGYIDATSSFVADKPRLTLGREHSFDHEIHNVSFKDSFIGKVDQDDLASAEYSQEVTVYGRTTKHSIVNDGFNAEQSYHADVISYLDTDGNELFVVDSVNSTVTVNARLVVNNPEDFKGDAGTIRYYLYQYAVTNSINDGDWHDLFDADTDKWRRQAEVTGTADSPIIGEWSTGFLLNAKDGLPGDTLYIEYQYAHALIPNSIDWHSGMHDEDIWRRERTIKNDVPISSWSEASRIRGFDGPEGSVADREYQYAVRAIESPTNTYHYNFVTGDHFRRERVVIYANQADYDASPPVPLSTGQWLNVAQIVPINGVDYGFKQTTISIYQRSITTPTAPTGDVTWDFTNLSLTPIGNLGDWQTTIPSGTGDLYIGVALATALGDTSDTIAPADWDISLWATSGYNTASIYLYLRSADESLPTSPATNIYNFSTRTFNDAVTPWSFTIPEGTESLYVAIAQASSTQVTDSVNTNEWQVSAMSTTGINQANVNIYQRKATKPANPSSTTVYSFTNGNLASLTGGWYSKLEDVPESSNPLWLGSATAISLDITDSIATSEWDVVKYSEDGVSTANVTMYMTGDSPTAFPTTATYNYSTGVLSIVGETNGWQQSPPYNAQGKIWLTQITIVASAGVVTETILAARWATAILFVEDGYQATSVNIYRTTPHTTTSVASNSGNILFNFDTNTITGMSSLWTSTIPTSQGKIWVQRGIARGLVTVTTDTIPAAEMSNPEVLVTDGKTVDIVSLFAISATAPTVSWASVTHNINTHVYTFSGTNTANWQPTVPNNVAEGGKVWYITNAKLTTDNTDIVVHSKAEFTSPTVFTANGTNGIDGDDGSPGAPGTPGKHGQGSFRKSYNGNPDNLSNAVKDADVSNIANRPAQSGDSINYYWTGATGVAEYSRYYFRGASTWTEASFVVNGSAIIDGTLAAIKLQANTITGREVSSATTLIAGSGSTQAGVNGFDSGIYNGYRFWAGSATPSAANFSVKSDGTLRASNGHFSGTITMIGTSGLKVESSTPFGPNNLLEWRGSKSGKINGDGTVNLNSLTKVNAVTYYGDDNTAYFGGAIIAGTLTTSTQNPTTSNIPSVSSGSFGSNGGQIAVLCSLSSTGTTGYTAGGCPTTPRTNPSVVFKLYSDNVLVRTETATGSVTCDPEDGGKYEYYFLSDSFTYYDNVNSTANRNYRLDATISNSFGSKNQRLSIVTQEA